MFFSDGFDHCHSNKENLNFFKVLVEADACSPILVNLLYEMAHLYIILPRGILSHVYALT